jgi:FMN phosphatase YigB (HAD superfamily)
MKRLPLIAGLAFVIALTWLATQAANASPPGGGPQRARLKGPVVTCELPWLFFDLGADTIVDTQTDDFKKVYYMPGAHEYLADLRAKGYHLGLLVNIPASWGDTQEAKLEATQKFIADLWTDKIPLDWDQFDLGVAFPPTDAERKPAPYLFEQAIARAAARQCDAVYQGALADEIPAADAAGMHGIRLGAGLWDGSYYYPEPWLRSRVFPHD